VGARRLAREIAFRVLFESEAAGEDPVRRAEEVLDELSPHGEAREYVRRIVRTFDRNEGAVESAIRAASTGWRLERMVATDRAVLKVAAVELMYFGDVPARVAIDEAVDIAKKFGTEDSGRFVNGVLDALGRAHRKEELEAR